MRPCKLRGEISWKTFHDIFKRNANLQANLRKAPSFRQRFYTLVTVNKMFQTTIAAVNSYFPEKESAAAFLTP